MPSGRVLRVRFPTEERRWRLLSDDLPMHEFDAGIGTPFSLPSSLARWAGENPSSSDRVRLASNRSMFRLRAPNKT